MRTAPRRQSRTRKEAFDRVRGDVRGIDQEQVPSPGDELKFRTPQQLRQDPLVEGGDDGVVVAGQHEGACGDPWEERKSAVGKHRAELEGVSSSAGRMPDPAGNLACDELGLAPEPPA